MVKQTLDEAFVKMGEFMPVMLVNLSQDALRAMLLSVLSWIRLLLQSQKRIELDKLTQLLRHGFSFNHKMADKSGAVGEL